MAQATGIISQQHFNQLQNGEDFTLNLTKFTRTLSANVGDLVKSVYQIDIGYESEADAFGTWDVVGSAGANLITRSTGSFLGAGFQVGDQIDYFIDLSSGTPTVTSRTITIVTDFSLVFDGSAVANQTASSTAGVQIVTPFLNFEFDFNLPDTLATGYGSLIDGFTKKYTVDIDDGFGGQSTSFVSGTYQASFPTSQDDDGSFKMKFVSNEPNNVQRFEIEHIRRVKPYYLDGQLGSLQTGAFPLLFAGSGSLINLFQLTALTDQISASNKIFISKQSASIGYFGEVFNGGSKYYDFVSIDYTDKLTTLAVDGLQVGRVTQVQAEIESSSLNLDIDQNYGVYISKLPDQGEYQNNQNTFDVNFVFDSKVNERNSAPVDGDYIKQLEITAGSPASDRIVLNFEVDFSTDQQSLLDDKTYYLINIFGGVPNKQETDRENIIADVELFVEETDVEGLLQVQDFEFLTHPDAVGLGYTDVKRPNEAKFLSILDISIDLSLNAFLKKITQRLVAFNVVDNTFFDIEKNEFDVSNVIISGGVQQIEIDQTKGYKLVAGSLFNKKKISTGAKVGDDQFYKIEMANTFNWMDYLPLNGVDPVFYDNALANNGLNQKIERYSGTSNYNILVFWDFVVGNGVSDTTYRVRSTNLDVLDYDESSVSDPFSAQQIQVFLSDQITEITGNISPTETMYIKATFTPSAPIDPSIAYYGILRTEKYQAGGLNDIWERSSIEDSAPNNPILPLSGQVYLTVTNNGTDITVEGRLDPSRLTNVAQGETISLSAEIGQLVPDGKVTEAGSQKFTESSDYKIIE
jgi:hypothetical protein